jgi:hypothetical protein
VSTVWPHLTLVYTKVAVFETEKTDEGQKKKQKTWETRAGFRRRRELHFRTDSDVLVRKGLSEKLFIKSASPCNVCKVSFIYLDSKWVWATKPLTALCRQK